MCMITYLPPFVPVPYTGIANGGTWNEDGHGWAVAAELGHMIVGRFMELDEALDTFMDAREAYPHAPAVFHSRWATHGLVNTRNVHPFNVGSPHTVVAHNGVLPAAFHPRKKDPRSDTAILAAEWLGNQSRGTWTRKERRRVGSLIGATNKLAILSVDPSLSKPRGWLVNGDMGEWDRGAWFSNGDYRSAWSRGRYLGASASTSLFRGGSFLHDECPVCFAHGAYIDPVANVCECCHSCLDCAENVDECLCHYGRSTGKELELQRCDSCGAADCGCKPVERATPFPGWLS